MSESTPRPWHRSRREWDDSDTICTEDGRCVAVRPALVSADGWTPDAALIVRAVNAFDDLLAACEFVLAGTLQMGSDWSDEASLRLQAAIAKART